MNGLAPALKPRPGEPPSLKRKGGRGRPPSLKLKEVESAETTLQETPEDIGTFDRMVLKNLAPRDAMAEFERRGLEARHLGGYDYDIKTKKGWQALDPEGFDWRDLTDILPMVALTPFQAAGTVAGAAAGTLAAPGAGTVAGGIAGAGAGTAAGEAALQGAYKLFGYPVSARGAASRAVEEGVYGAAGEVAGQAIGAGVRGARSFLRGKPPLSPISVEGEVLRAPALAPAPGRPQFYRTGDRSKDPFLPARAQIERGPTAPRGELAVEEEILEKAALPQQPKQVSPEAPIAPAGPTRRAELPVLARQATIPQKPISVEEEILKAPGPTSVEAEILEGRGRREDILRQGTLEWARRNPGRINELLEALKRPGAGVAEEVAPKAAPQLEGLSATGSGVGKAAPVPGLLGAKGVAAVGAGEERFTRGHLGGLAEHAKSIADPEQTASIRIPGWELKADYVVDDPLEAKRLIETHGRGRFSAWTQKNVDPKAGEWGPKTREFKNATLKPPGEDAPLGKYVFSQKAGSMQKSVEKKKLHNIATLWELDDAGQYLTETVKVGRGANKVDKEVYKVRALHFDEIGMFEAGGKRIKFVPKPLEPTAELGPSIKAPSVEQKPIFVEKEGLGSATTPAPDRPRFYESDPRSKDPFLAVEAVKQKPRPVVREAVWGGPRTFAAPPTRGLPVATKSSREIPGHAGMTRKRIPVDPWKAPPAPMATGSPGVRIGGRERIGMGLERLGGGVERVSAWPGNLLVRGLERAAGGQLPPLARNVARLAGLSAAGYMTGGISLAGLAGGKGLQALGRLLARNPQPVLSKILGDSTAPRGLKALAMKAADALERKDERTVRAIIFTLLHSKAFRDYAEGEQEDE